MINRGVLIHVIISDSRGYHIYRSLFFDYLKNEGTQNVFDISRVVAMTFNDEIELMRHEPTVFHVSQRMFSLIAASDEKRKFKACGVDQAFTHA